MRLWLIPTSCVATSVVCAFALPRIKHAYLGSYTSGLSVSSAQAYSLTNPAQVDAVHQYLKHLDLVIDCSSLYPEDRVAARQEDRQGLGLSRTQAEAKARLK